MLMPASRRFSAQQSRNIPYCSEGDYPYPEYCHQSYLLLRRVEGLLSPKGRWIMLPQKAVRIWLDLTRGFAWPSIVSVTTRNLHLNGDLPPKSSQFSTLWPTRLDEIENLHSLDSIDTESLSTRGRSVWVHSSQVRLVETSVPHNDLPERVEPLGWAWRVT